ncbi:MAG: endolytic transglycosylase MltG [Muribaculaceae bacterium]|nr:endolytic transglycosylase MltG [Muribaculaceae bacterium]
MDVKQLVFSILETVIKIAAAIFIIMFVYDAAVKAYDYGYRVFAEEPMTVGEGRTISIYIKEDDSVKDIGEDLESKGLIRDANLFVIQELLSENHGEIQPGVYDLNTSMRSEEMLAIMAAGEDEADSEEEDDS